jgi:transposase-like protein
LSINTYKRHRFHPSITSYAVWVYYRFSLSFRDIEDLLAEKGISVSYEAIRLWCIKFGPAYARNHGGEPRTIVTDKLASYKVAQRELMLTAHHKTAKYENNGTDKLTRWLR